MIKIEFKENGVKNSNGFGNNVTIEVMGNGDVIAAQLKAMLGYLDESAHEPLMTAIEHFFLERLGKFGEGDNDYDE